MKYILDSAVALQWVLPEDGYASRATDIASQMHCGVYDCLYVALAEKEACELVTADDKLVKNLKKMFPFILPLASLP